MHEQSKLPHHHLHSTLSTCYARPPEIAAAVRCRCRCVSSATGGRWDATQVSCSCVCSLSRLLVGTPSGTYTAVLGKIQESLTCGHNKTTFHTIVVCKRGCRVSTHLHRRSDSLLNGANRASHHPHPFNKRNDSTVVDIHLRRQQRVAEGILHVDRTDEAAVDETPQ